MGLNATKGRKTEINAIYPRHFLATAKAVNPPDVGGKVRRQRPAGAFDGLRHAVGKLAQDRQHLLPGDHHGEHA
jgi:hypothetical protein